MANLDLLHLLYLGHIQLILNISIKIDVSIAENDHSASNPLDPLESTQMCTNNVIDSEESLLRELNLPD